jgi:hypothetical protein
MSEPISNPDPQTNSPHAPYLAALQRLARSGFQSSEFWLVVTALALLALAAWGTQLPPEVSCYLGTALVFGYKYFRAQIKATNGDQVIALADRLAQDPRAALAHPEAALFAASPSGADAAGEAALAIPQTTTPASGAPAPAPIAAASH